MTRELFLSEQDEEVIVNFLYEAGIYIAISKEHEYLIKLEDAMKKLEPTGAKIVNSKYLSSGAEYIRHQAIYKEMQMSPAIYKKHRLRALTKLAAELGLMHCNGENEAAGG
ncbi:hypothetical protein D3C81_1593090 [compost metagenome]